MFTTEAEIISLLEEHFYAKKGDIHGDTPLEQIISDSMDFIELVAVMATRYKISIDPKNVAHIRTVRDVAEFVSKSKYADDSTVASF